MVDRDPRIGVPSQWYSQLADARSQVTEEASQDVSMSFEFESPPQGAPPGVYDHGPSKCHISGSDEQQREHHPQRDNHGKAESASPNKKSRSPQTPVESQASTDRQASEICDDSASEECSSAECKCFDLVFEEDQNRVGEASTSTATDEAQNQIFAQAARVYNPAGPLSTTMHKRVIETDDRNGSLLVFRADLQAAYVQAPFTGLYAFGAWMPSKELAYKSLYQCLMQAPDGSDSRVILQPATYFPYQHGRGGQCSACKGHYMRQDLMV